MRVMMVAGDPISCDNYGGVEEHTSNLISHLFNIDQIDLQVLMFPCPYDKIRHGRIHYLKRLTKKRILYPFYGLLDVIRLIKEINRYLPDVVHFQGTSPLFCITALITQRKYATVLTMHGVLIRETNYWSESNLFFRILSKYIEKYVILKLKHLIVVAPQIQEIIKRTKSTYVIPNGVEIDEIEKITQDKIDRAHTIIFIGNLIERKGVHILIEALKIAKCSIPDIHLLVAGSGPQEVRLKEMVLASGLNDNVSFLGYLTGEAKFSHIKAAMFLVVPSLWESLQIVILEGMACGKAIVASNVGGIPYLIEEGINGYLVEPGDVQDLAQKIILLLENDEVLVNMGKASLEKVREFTWENIARKTFEIYSTLVNSSGEHGPEGSIS